MLTTGAYDPVTILDVLDAFHVCQVPNSVVRFDLWIVKRKHRPRTDIEEQRTMFNQVRYAPVAAKPATAPIACRAVTSLKKPACPEHVVQIVHSPFKMDFKFAHF
jgi:hypothetical protein